jgi:class 3 adenylate cyclase
MSVEVGEGLLCIMFTDLVGWTELGERVGDDAADALRRDHFATIRTALEMHRGHEIKSVGDSVMSTFRSALDALRCAVTIQAEASQSEVRVRMGVRRRLRRRTARAGRWLRRPVLGVAGRTRGSMSLRRRTALVRIPRRTGAVQRA